MFCRNRFSQFFHQVVSFRSLLRFVYVFMRLNSIFHFILYLSLFCFFPPNHPLLQQPKHLHYKHLLQLLSETSTSSQALNSSRSHIKKSIAQLNKTTQIPRIPSCILLHRSNTSLKPHARVIQRFVCVCVCACALLCETVI